MDLIENISTKYSQDPSKIAILASTAIQESKEMGMEENNHYFLEVLENLLDIKEGSLKQYLLDMYIKSDEKNFDSFLEGMMISSNFTITPESIVNTKKKVKRGKK
jgi:hypothetical protein